MEVNLTGLQLPVQIVLAILLLMLGMIGRRLLDHMDRLTASVEALNKSMAVVLATNEGFERRLERLESHAVGV